MSLEKVNCFVCGASFVKPRKNATCCSPECAKRKEVLREFERRKEKRATDANWLKNERTVNARARKNNKDKERARSYRWRKENPEKVSSQRRRYLERMSPERKAEKRMRYHESHPEAKVRTYLKSQLGITPPPELVEEATALRLLNRAIRKAGE